MVGRFVGADYRHPRSTWAFGLDTGHTVETFPT